MSKLSRLTALPRALLAEGYVGVPAYRTIRELAIGGLFPARQINTVWHFSPQDIGWIAGVLELNKANAKQREIA